MVMIQNFTAFVKKHDRHISSGALIFGFIIDNLTLNRIDRAYDNAVLVFYLVLVGCCILLFNMVEIRNLTSSFAQKIKIFAPIIIQFAFGGLFSAFFVFYSRSGSFGSSWPFLTLILGLLIINEFLKEKYSRLIYQVTIYFFTIFSYMIFLVPLITKKIGPNFFIASGIISLGLIYLFNLLIHIATKQKYFNFNKKLWAGIISIFIVMNVFYFTNILPPLPLSMKDSGVFNLIEKKNESYVLSRESITWLNKFFNNTITVTPGKGLYYFSSIFAPAKLDTKIVHEWQYYDKANRKWIQSSKIFFSILGGRDQGYRGYSFKQNLTEGEWRVLTKTLNGQIIGEEKFNIVFKKESLDLKSETK